MRNPISIHSEDRSPSETSHLCSLAGCDGVVDRSADPYSRSASLPTRWLASGGDVLGGRAGASGTVRRSRAGAGRALAERRGNQHRGLAVTTDRVGYWPDHVPGIDAAEPAVFRSEEGSDSCAIQRRALQARGAAAQMLEKFSDSSYATSA